MKLCPKCHQVYADETLNFCLSDGAALVHSSNQSEETIVMGLPGQSEKTVAINPPVVSGPQQPLRQGVSPLFAYLAIGLLALLVGGSVMAWLKAGSSPPSNIVPQSNVANISITPYPPAANVTNAKETPVN